MTPTGPTPHPGPASPATASPAPLLAAAHAMPGGADRERRITELLVAAITAAIRDRHPHARSAEFDWAAYGGLDLTAVRDGTGAEICDTSLAGDLAQWNTDLRSPDIAGMTRTAYGVFRLDLHTAARADRQ
ncbi:hypothetical protein [Nocardia thraciensis]